MEITKTKNLEFNENGFLLVKNLCDPTNLIRPVPDTLEDKVYYGSMDRVYIKPKSVNTQVYNSCETYAYPLYKNYHSEIKNKVEKILGVPLLRTYYFDRFYFSGSDLKRHVDRPACEISVTVNISSNIDNWNFYIESKSGDVCSYDLNPGDGLIYMGYERPHWRHPLPSRHKKIKNKINKIFKIKDDTYYHQIFFHYVMSDGYFVEYSSESHLHK